MKSKNHEYTAKLVAAILCAAWMLTACGNTEAGSVDETMEPVTETTTEITTEPTKEVVTEPTETEVPVAESTEEPVKTSEEISATEPVAVTAESGVKSSAEPVTASAGTTAETGYTCTEMNQTMYAKSAVNVRDLPGTDGQKIGGLQAGQEISVTGKCDQTGWYRFDLNGTTAYVSDKYIVAEKPAQTATANNGGKTTQSTAAATGSTTAGEETSITGAEEYFDRAMAEQEFALVNEERTANGIPALIWNEELYNIAVQRCYENDIHNGMRNGTSENYAFGFSSAQELYQGWHDSKGHHDTYMRSSWAYSAVAVRFVPLVGGALGYDIISYQVFAEEGSAALRGDTSAIANSPNINNPYVTSITINGETYYKDGEAPTPEYPAATKTPNDGTSTGTANVGWSLTPPMQEDGLKNWQEQNPDAEVSFGN